MRGELTVELEGDGHVDLGPVGVAIASWARVGQAVLHSVKVRQGDAQGLRMPGRRRGLVLVLVRLNGVADLEAEGVLDDAVVHLKEDHAGAGGEEDGLSAAISECIVHKQCVCKCHSCMQLNGTHEIAVTFFT